MDPFEVRMSFTRLLSHLSASHTSHTKAAVFALKNREMDEDLHSCILEQLERTSTNNRANIMYFIDVLCELAKRENVLEFVRMMQRDILRVVDAVVPSDGSGAANVKVVRKVLRGLSEKGILMQETVGELEGVLREREGGGTHPFVVGEDSQSSKGSKNGSLRLDKRQIEQRIEEDRERHKRLRESIWAVSGEEEKEMEKLWEEASDIADDDLFGAEEDDFGKQETVEFT